jgi:hypothetical protein
MKVFFVVLISMVCLIPSGRAEVPGREAVYFETFASEKDYTRILRTAQAAQRWEIVPDATAEGGKVLRVHYLFENPMDRSLLVFDLAPVHFGDFTIRARIPETLEAPVRLDVALNDTKNDGFVFPAIQLSPDGRWQRYRVSFALPLRNVIQSGNSKSDHKLCVEEIDALAFVRIIYHVSLPPDSPLLGQPFFIDFDLLECFPNTFTPEKNQPES